jgi:uncharacterized membrane protein
MSIPQKYLDELASAGIISADTVRNIEHYYSTRQTAAPNRQFLVFGILGAIMIGLGIILILAHNWDEFPRKLQIALAFLPLLIGQFLCAFSLIRKNENAVWRESSATLLTFAIGGAISLVAQIYNISGDFAGFMFTWSVLTLPVLYLMRSSLASMLYIIGITVYAVNSKNGFPSQLPFWYLLLFALVLPYYHQLLKTGQRNFTVWHHWLLAISLLLALDTFETTIWQFTMLSYISLLGIFYMNGKRSYFSESGLFSNPWLLFGSLGTLVILVPLSFNWFWDTFFGLKINWETAITSPEVIAAVLITIAASVAFIYHLSNKALRDISPIAPVFILFAIAFCLGFYSYASPIIINLLILGIGLLTVRTGIRQDHLGILNYGLLIIAVLVACRFFDTDLSFAIRGLLFIAVGAGFIAANTKLLKNRRVHEK